MRWLGFPNVSEYGGRGLDVVFGGQGDGYVDGSNVGKQGVSFFEQDLHLVSSSSRLLLLISFFFSAWLSPSFELVVPHSLSFFVYSFSYLKLLKGNNLYIQKAGRTNGRQYPEPSNRNPDGFKRGGPCAWKTIACTC